MINNKEIQKTEIINGVTVVYGNYEVTDDPQINKLLYLNSIKFYDLDGNEFYANYDDINEAYYEMCYLIERGITSVIGPKAPVKDYDLGEISVNYHQDGVGLYIIKEKQKRLAKEKN